MRLPIPFIGGIGGKKKQPDSAQSQGTKKVDYDSLSPIERIRYRNDQYSKRLNK